jgi:hypothetical protein
MRKHYKRHHNYKRKRHSHHKRHSPKSKNRGFDFSNVLNFNLFYIGELPFVLLSLFILISSLFTFGLFVFPIFAIAVAGGILRWINPDTSGLMFAYHTLALSGVFMLIVIIMLYRTFVPLFQMF